MSEIGHIFKSISHLHFLFCEFYAHILVSYFYWVTSTGFLFCSSHLDFREISPLGYELWIFFPSLACLNVAYGGL